MPPERENPSIDAVPVIDQESQNTDIHFRELLILAQEGDVHILCSATLEFYYVYIAHKIQSLVRFQLGESSTIYAPDDCVQDVAERLTKGILSGNFQLKSLPQLYRWCFTVAQNLTISRQRVEKVKPMVELVEAGNVQKPSDQGEIELSVAIMGALQSLNHSDRHVIECDVSGMNTYEVAQTLGISPDAASKRLQRARRRLRIQLARLELDVA